MLYAVEINLNDKRHHQSLFDFSTTTPNIICKTYKILNHERCYVYLDGRLLIEGGDFTLEQLGAKPMCEIKIIDRDGAYHEKENGGI